MEEDIVGGKWPMNCQISNAFVGKGKAEWKQSRRSEKFSSEKNIEVNSAGVRRRGENKFDPIPSLFCAALPGLAWWKEKITTFPITLVPRIFYPCTLLQPEKREKTLELK